MARALRLAAALAAFLSLLIGPSAAAQVDGACTAFFNGVEAERIDGIDSPLELRDNDILTFHGTDEAGTQAAYVGVSLSSVTIDSSTTTYGPLEQEYSAALDLEEVSPYGVGLFRVRGTTDNCTVEAWVRITGRYPFATLTGLTAGGLTLAGFAGQLASIASRKRWSPIAAALAGIATGAGGAVIGQQFGRLQLSYPAIGASVAGAAVVGAGLAALFREKREKDHSGFMTRRKQSASEKRAIRYQARLEAARLDAARREQESPPEPAVTTDAEQALTPALGETATPITVEPEAQEESDAATPPPATTPTPAVLPYWCYVMTDVETVALEDHTRVIGTLTPGNWYLAKREVGAWAQVVVGEGVEGWVPTSSINRHG